MDTNKNNEFDALKKLIDSHEFEFNEAAWQKMEEKLNTANVSTHNGMKNPGIARSGLIGILALLLITGAYYFSNGFSPKNIQGQRVVISSFPIFLTNDQNINEKVSYQKNDEVILTVGKENQNNQNIAKSDLEKNNVADSDEKKLENKTNFKAKADENNTQIPKEPFENNFNRKKHSHEQVKHKSENKPQVFNEVKDKPEVLSEENSIAIFASNLKGKFPKELSTVGAVQLPLLNNSYKIPKSNHFGLIVGKSNIEHDISSVLNNSGGYYGGIFYNSVLNDKWALDFELSYKGVEINDMSVLYSDTLVIPKGISVYNESMRIDKMHYIEMPVTLSYKLPGGRSSFKFGVKPSYTHRLFVEKRVRSSNRSSSGLSDDGYVFDNSLRAVRRYAFGVVFGYEYRFLPKFAIDVKYTKGLVDQSIDSWYYNGVKNTNSGFQFGIKFYMK